MVHEAPLVFRDRVILGHKVVDEVFYMAFQDFTYYWENRYWSAATYR